MTGAKKQLSELSLREDNPRKISEADLDKILKSIEGFEKMMAIRPIVVDEDGVILGGSQRYRALVGAGYKEVPEEWIDVQLDLTEEEKKEFIIKDNAPVSGQWDFDGIDTWTVPELEEYGFEDPSEFFIDTNFDPNLNPGTSGKLVGEKDLAKAAGKLEKMGGVADKRDVVCPHCGEDFQINNYS